MGADKVSINGCSKTSVVTFKLLHPQWIVLGSCLTLCFEEGEMEEEKVRPRHWERGKGGALKDQGGQINLSFTNPGLTLL